MCRYKWMEAEQCFLTKWIFNSIAYARQRPNRNELNKALDIPTTFFMASILSFFLLIFYLIWMVCAEAFIRRNWDYLEKKKMDKVICDGRNLMFVWFEWPIGLIVQFGVRNWRNGLSQMHGLRHRTALEFDCARVMNIIVGQCGGQFKRAIR